MRTPMTIHMLLISPKLLKDSLLFPLKAMLPFRLESFNTFWTISYPKRSFAPREFFGSKKVNVVMSFISLANAFPSTTPLGLDSAKISWC